MVKFLAGFASAGVAQTIGGSKFVLGLTKAGQGIARIVTGGLASVAGGGKFKNGAVTAAFAYAFNELRHQYEFNKLENAQEKKGLWDSVKEGGSAKVGLGAGFHLKEAKAGPLKVGGGVVFGSGGLGLDADGLSVWGNSTADAQLSLGRYGGRVYLWNVDVDSSGVNNVGMFGVSSPDWNWSTGIGGTITPYSFEFEYDFQPLIDYFKGSN